MAKKISKKIVLDYISGNDILDYDIDELENNHEFMMDVIRFTKENVITTGPKIVIPSGVLRRMFK